MQPKHKASMNGTFTPAEDLQPAIDALTDIGRAWLMRETKGRDIQSDDIGHAADFSDKTEMGELK